MTEEAYPWMRQQQGPRPALRVIEGGGKPEQGRAWVASDPGPEASALRGERRRREAEKRAREYERRWHTIYRLFDAKGRLLYVGISANGPGRLPQHAKDKAWFRKVATATFEHVKGRSAAEARELEAIRSENPKWNRAGKPKDPS